MASSHPLMRIFSLKVVHLTTTYRIS